MKLDLAKRLLEFKALVDDLSDRYDYFLKEPGEEGDFTEEEGKQLLEIQRCLNNAKWRFEKL